MLYPKWQHGNRGNGPGQRPAAARGSCGALDRPPRVCLVGPQQRGRGPWSHQGRLVITQLQAESRVVTRRGLAKQAPPDPPAARGAAKVHPVSQMMEARPRPVPARERQKRLPRV